MRSCQIRLFAAIIVGVVATTAGVLSAAEVVTIAGTGKDAYSGDGGPALAAELGQPFGLEIGPDGALYFCAYSNHIIRRMDLKTNTVSTVAGTGRKVCYSGDGAAAT